MLGYYAIIVLIGIVIGIVTYVFGTILNLISSFIVLAYPYNLILLPLVGLLTILLTMKYRDNVKNSMHSVFTSARVSTKLSPLIIPFQMVTTWLAHIAGASVGREGVAVQLGATIANYAAEFDNSIDRTALSRIGMAAGFAGLFGTPLAATVFCFEVTRRKSLDLHLLIGALIATHVSSGISTLLGLNHFHLNIEYMTLSARELILLVFCIILFIGIGHLFAIGLKQIKQFISEIKVNWLLKILVLSSAFMLLIYFVNDGRYMSLGTNLIEDAFFAPENILVFDFGFKMLFTIIFVSIGFQGGEVTPLFAIGSSLGAMLATILMLPVTIVSAIGYAFTFGNATNAYFTAAVLAIEVFGIGIFPYVLIALVITLFIRNDSHTIYPNLEWE